MKKRSWLIGLFALAFLLSACSALPANTMDPEAQVAPTEEKDTAEQDVIEGVVLPAQISSMRFLLAGPLATLNVEEGSRVREGDLLATLSTPALDSAVLAAEAELRAAKADLQYWLIPRRNKPPERRWLAEDRIEVAKAAINTTLAEQQQQNLLAPYDATVIEVHTAAGEVVGAQQEVLLLADTKNIKVETTNLSERDVVQLAIGQKVALYIEALDLETEGTVTAISMVGEEKEGDVFFPVTIELDEIPDGLRWGMTVEVELENG